MRTNTNFCFLIILHYYLAVCVRGRGRGRTYKSEDNLWELVFSFHNVGSRDRTPIRLGSKDLYLQSHPVSQRFLLLMLYVSKTTKGSPHPQMNISRNWILGLECDTVLECMPSIPEALGSTPGTTKPKIRVQFWNATQFLRITHFQNLSVHLFTPWPSAYYWQLPTTQC